MPQERMKGKDYPKTDNQKYKRVDPDFHGAQRDKADKEYEAIMKNKNMPAWENPERERKLKTMYMHDELANKRKYTTSGQLEYNREKRAREKKKP